MIGLEGVEAPKGLVDEGQRGLRGVEKERVIVAANEAIEGGKFSRRKAFGVPWCYVVVLQGSLSIRVPIFEL